MKLLFATEAFRDECNNQDRLVKRYGARGARLIRQRLDELFNAKVLEDVRSLPHVSIQGLAGDGDALAIEVGASRWLAFRPESTVSGTASPPVDWKKVDCIRILGLVKTDGKNRPKPI